jgi:hypothetical protein
MNIEGTSLLRLYALPFVRILLILSLSLHFPLLWRASPILSQLLNGWNEFQREFPEVSSIDIRRKRNFYLVFHLIIPMITLGTVTFVSKDLETAGIGHIVMLLVTSYSPTLLIQSEDIKEFLLLQVLQISYQKVSFETTLNIDQICYLRLIV